MRASYEVLGIGAPFIDYIVEVDNAFIEKLPGEKGGMVLVDYETLRFIVEQSGSRALVISGGSGANTIKGLANFGHSCALVGKIGSDEAGKLFLKAMEALSVTPLLIQTDTPTAQAVCLITPEGERTMRSYLGAAQGLAAKDLKPAMFKDVRLVHVEGYTLFKEGLTERAMKLAKAAGAKVSFDLGSFEVVHAYRETIMDLLDRYVDIVFANRDEIQALTYLTPEEGGVVLSGMCEISVALLGAEGSLISSGSQQIKVPTFEVDVVDTTGAGDLFASGFLHGYLKGCALQECARRGALAGSAVVQVLGAELSPKAWLAIKTQVGS